MNFQAALNEIFRNPSGKLWIQVFRYLVSGGVAFLVDTGLLALLTETLGREHLLVWTAISFSVGLLVTYLFSILWVFDNRSVSNRAVEVGIFICIGVAGLGLTELFMWLFADRCGIHYLISKCITTVLVFVWNFVAKKTILFREK